jgi:hypothetical protein
VSGEVKVDYRVDEKDVLEEYAGMTFLHLAALTDCDVAFFKFLEQTCGVPYVLAGTEQWSPRVMVEHRQAHLKKAMLISRTKINHKKVSGQDCTSLSVRLLKQQATLSTNMELLDYLSDHRVERERRVDMSAVLGKLSLLDKAVDTAKHEQEKEAADRKVRAAWRRTGQTGGAPTFDVTFMQDGDPGIGLVHEAQTGHAWVGDIEEGEAAAEHPVLAAALAMAAARQGRLLVLGIDGPLRQNTTSSAAMGDGPQGVGRPMVVHIQLEDAAPVTPPRTPPRMLPSLQLGRQPVEPRITERVRQLLATEKSTFETVAHLAEPDGALLDLRQERRAVLARGVRRLDVNGWVLEPPVLKLWRGCRDGDELTEGLDPESAAIALHLLALTRELAPHPIEEIRSQHNLAPVSPQPTWDEGLYSFGSPIRESR